MARLPLLKSLIIAFYHFASASGLSRAVGTCNWLSTVLGNGTISPLQSQYPALSTENWSATAWQKPTCIVQPNDTPTLAEVVKILTIDHVQFAIRSGGHMPSPLAANINNGILIDLSRFNHVHYDATKSLVTVGSGSRWEDLYSAIDPYNVTVVGGRVLDVGVGGLTLGCGLSYLSDLSGLVCDNVIGFDVVLANGTSVHANVTSHKDLFRALKGGSNNFGIVTQFKLSTFSIGQIWGGIKSYSLEQLPALFAAMFEYQSNPNKDPYANLMFQAFTTNATVGGVLNMVYLKPEILPPAFAPFYSIPTTGDTTKIQTLTQMISGQRVPAIPRWDWFAISLKPSTTLYQKIASIITTAPELKTLESITAGSLALGLQPISSSLIQAGNAMGGNALGLQNVNQTWFVLDVGWWHPSDDDVVHNATRAIHDRIRQEAKSEGKLLEYIFMNDASYDQDVIKHYGAKNVKQLREVQRKYDPKRVFQNLVSGGFKLP